VVVAEPVGGAVEGDGDAAVEESVEHGGGDGRVAENLALGRYIRHWRLRLRSKGQ
jgi:hypothetical protein